MSTETRDRVQVSPARNRVIAIGVEPSAPGEHGHWLRLIFQAITGRRIVAGELLPIFDRVVKQFLDSFTSRREAVRLASLRARRTARARGPAADAADSPPQLGTNGSDPIGVFERSLDHVFAKELVAAAIPRGHKCTPASDPSTAFRRTQRSSPYAGIAGLLLRRPPPCTGLYSAATRRRSHQRYRRHSALWPSLSRLRTTPESARWDPCQPRDGGSCQGMPARMSPP